ncbi:MAG: ABC transporter permease [Planctomycetota bacterium]|jgi:lipoprotein-releasing system permease protein
MYKWFLAWRYLHTKLIAIFGVASVMLCVAMVLVVMSVMGGFLDTIRQRSRGLHSEIVLEGRSLQGFPYYQEFTDYLLENHGDLVKTATPTIHSYGLLRIPDTQRTKPTQIVGIRLRDYGEVNSFTQGLHYDHFFPGTTHLGKQGMTVVGMDEQTGQPIFPEELAKASETWNETELDEEKKAEFGETPIQFTLAPQTTLGLPAQFGFPAKYGEPDLVGPERFGIIVGSDLIHYRRSDGKFDRMYVRGAPMVLTVLPLTETGVLTGAPPVNIPLRYVDDSRTGIFEIDSLCVYVNFDMLQRKLSMDAQEFDDGEKTLGRASQLLIGLHAGVPLDAGWRRVDRAWEEFKKTKISSMERNSRLQLEQARVLTWEDIQAPLIAAVEKEKVLVTFLFGLISVVAIVLLGCIFYMIVEKKTRDIGILKSLGASASGVAGMFIVYALAIGVVGSLLGTLLGSVFVWNINDIQEFLASLNPNLRVWSAEVYSFDKIPEVVKTNDAFWIAVVAVISSMLGSLIPATIAGRVWPVRALRYE